MPEELETLEQKSQRLGIPEPFLKELNGRIDTPEEEKAAEELWKDLPSTERAKWMRGAVEASKEYQKGEEEVRSQTERWEKFSETGRDPEDVERERLGRLKGKARTLAAKLGISPKEYEYFIESASEIDLLEYISDLEGRKRGQAELEKTKLSREKWVGRAAAAGAITAGVHTLKQLFPGRPAPSRVGGAAPRGRVTTGLGTMAKIHLPIAPKGFYSSAGMQPLTAPPKPLPAIGQPVRVDIGGPLRKGIGLESLRKATEFAPTRVSPRPNGLGQLTRGWQSPLGQLVTPTRPTPRVPTRVMPTTVPTPTPTRDETIPTRLEQYIRQKGAEPVEKIGMPTYFWIGTKRGVESSDNAWVVRMETGRYGIMGLGSVTGQPRSKISWGTPEEAFDAAGDIPGEGKYPVIG